MNFLLSETHSSIRDTARQFARASLRESERWDHAGELPESLVETLASLGFMGMTLDEKRGGTGLDALAVVLVLSELAVHDASAALLVATHNATLKAAELNIDVSDFVSGRKLALPGIARRLRLFVPNRAALFSTEGTLRSSCVLEPMHCLGLRAAAWRLNPEAAEASSQPSEIEVLNRAAIAVGIGDGALRAAVAYARDRQQFGQPIANFQAIQWKIANAATELEAARWLVYRSAQTGHNTSMALRYAAPAAVRACDYALQIHGGYGYTRDFPVERALRDARTLAALPSA